MRNDLDKKANLEETNEQFGKYCQYKSLKDLYNKVLPPLSAFEQTLNQYTNEFEQIK